MKTKTKELEELQDLIDEIRFEKQRKIKELFTEIVPNNTTIYILNDDYTDQKVADFVEVFAYDDYGLIVKGVKFKFEDGGLYCIECLSDDEDEIWDCFWNVGLGGETKNIDVIKRLLYSIEEGWYIKEGEEDVNLITYSQAEEEDEEDDEDED